MAVNLDFSLLFGNLSVGHWRTVIGYILQSSSFFLLVSYVTLYSHITNCVLETADHYVERQNCNLAILNLKLVLWGVLSYKWGNVFPHTCFTRAAKTGKELCCSEAMFTEFVLVSWSFLPTHHSSPFGQFWLYVKCLQASFKNEVAATGDSLFFPKRNPTVTKHEKICT